MFTAATASDQTHKSDATCAYFAWPAKGLTVFSEGWPAKTPLAPIRLLLTSLYTLVRLGLSHSLARSPLSLSHSSLLSLSPSLSTLVPDVFPSSPLFPTGAASHPPKGHEQPSSTKLYIC